MWKYVLVLATLVVNATAIHVAQLASLPLRLLLSRPLLARIVGKTQSAFVELIHLITAVFAPGSCIVATFPRESWAERLLDGVDHDERAVVISNHQTWTDWTYLWLWSYYLKYDAVVKIILKSSPKHVPIFGPGMQFFKFIFLARNWMKDQHTLRQGLHHIAEDDAFWLLLFPEGTIITNNTQSISQSYAQKAGISSVPKYTLVPRSTGLFTSINVLRQHKNPITHIYNLTIAFSPYPLICEQCLTTATSTFSISSQPAITSDTLVNGNIEQSKCVATHQHPSDLYKLRGVYCEGKYPRQIHVYCDRIAISDVPIDRVMFDTWLNDRFHEKSVRLERFYQTGRLDNNELTKTVRWNINPVVPWKLLGCWGVTGAAVATVWALIKTGKQTLQ